MVLSFFFFDGNELLRIFFFISHGLIHLHFPPTVRSLDARRIWKKRVVLTRVLQGAGGRRVLTQSAEEKTWTRNKDSGDYPEA